MEPDIRLGSELYWENIFLQFHHWKDKERVVYSQPWYFDHNALVPCDIIGDRKSPYIMYLSGYAYMISPFYDETMKQTLEKLEIKLGPF